MAMSIAGEVIQTGTVDRPQSSVKTCTVAFELFVKQAREARINSEFPTFGLGLFRKAMAAGYGEEEVDSADSKYGRCSAKLISMPHRGILAPCLSRFPHHSLD